MPQRSATTSGRPASLSRFRWVFVHTLCKFAPISLLIYSLDVALSMLFRQIVAWNDEEHYADSSQNSKDFGFIDAAGCKFSIKPSFRRRTTAHHRLNMPQTHWSQQQLSV
jgi:hypothetical protein